MKIRSGFVSNSSSSSFVFALPSKPRSVEELKNMLFTPEETFYVNPYTWDDSSPKGWPTEQIAKIVFDDISNPDAQDPAKMEDSFLNYREESDNDNFYNRNSIEDTMTQEERWAYWDETAKIAQEKAKKRRIEFLAANAGKEVYMIEISDDSQIGSAMEHGDLFKNVPSVRISNH